MTAIEDGRRFSDAVAEAQRLGYTEPDPRDDLSGRDVARKALILARALGRSVEFDDIALDDALLAPDADDALARRIAGGEILRYTARIDRRGIRVGLESVPASSPMARLRGTDNQVVIYSKRYKTNPLVVTGPGAGADVTAAGVLNDIVAITVQERRR
jgi:homoserine dehydrogenase